MKKLFDRLFRRNKTLIICCYFNYKNNPYRLSNFLKFFNQINDKDFKIIEMAKYNSSFELEDCLRLFPSNYVKLISDSYLWQKEALLNILIEQNLNDYDNIIWLDTDIIFKNRTWYEDTIEALKTHNIVQLFKACSYLNKHQTDNTHLLYELRSLKGENAFNSFAYNFHPSNIFDLSSNIDYKTHGHVGFAWAIKTKILKQIKLYDKALFGGADHIIAHAAAGHLDHLCVTKTFSGEQLNEINSYSKKFATLIDKKLGYVEGEILHLWHGDLKKRDYYNRIKSSSPEITSESISYTEDNLLISNNLDLVIKFDTYMNSREQITTNEIESTKNVLIDSAISENINFFS